MSAVFTSVMVGSCVPGIVTVDGRLMGGPLGGVPLAVPVLVMLPRSMSAWVVV